MEVEIRKTFDSDVRKIRDKRLLRQIERMITEVESSEHFSGISNLKKLKGYKNYYRIRVNDYRTGIYFENSVVVFVRFLHRKDIYRHFPAR